ncbi:hypothetical protein H072_6422 [Dactylellina haptotyla CBS 200.50]|uniref:GST N-terminal domain-containing protein n=1 Tax=Dactylellina haptotyla (strain CBS 200.50) TaxID=1284197 RepID=S8BX62_DACHA|nr:hypothetical protein H072_6422 [Dactylellina haptotyla CBS 200.50]
MPAAPPADLDISLTLYSNPGCPYVHRALTTLHELSLPFKSVHIDLEAPRPASYLAVNPRGTVPALTFSTSSDKKEVVVNESLVIIYFLADLFPNHLIPSAGPGNVSAAAERARIFYFIDTWGSKVSSALMKVFLASAAGAEGGEAAVDAVIEVIQKEMDPLLKREEGDGDGPFLGGRHEVTLAEIAVAPFVLRNFAWVASGLAPASLKERILALEHFGPWAAEIIKNENLVKEFDEATFVEKSKAKLQAFREGSFKPKV